jgi:hypothetical protein
MKNRLGSILVSLLLLVSAIEHTIVSGVTAFHVRVEDRLGYGRRAMSPNRLVSPSSSSEPSEAERLKQQAEKLRQEVAALEQSKRTVQIEERRVAEQARAEQAALRDRYSAIVPILKPDGTVSLEKCEFPPRVKDGSTFIELCEAALPLGILLGEGENEKTGLIVVDEVAKESNGAQGGLLEGDIVRAFTACKMGMDMPTWQVLAGGIGVPKTRRFMYSADGRPFEEVMDAVASNRMDPEQRPVLIVVERRETSTST